MTHGTQVGAAESATPRSIGLGEVRAADKAGSSSRSQPSTLTSQPLTGCSVTLLTGGGDKPYALGLAAALTSVGVSVEFIGSDDLNVPELVNNSRVNFLNLRGGQRLERSRFVEGPGGW